MVRKAFNASSNGFLEIQWYLFAAVFLLAAGYTMLRQEHVKIDVVLHRFSRPTQIKIEIFGILAFLFPFGLSLGGRTLRWATAQPICRSGDTWFFAAIPGIPARCGVQGRRHRPERSPHSP